MSEVDELTPAADRPARARSRLHPVAAALAAIAFLMFSAASFARIKAYVSTCFSLYQLGPPLSEP